jgi:hypothetical protein
MPLPEKILKDYALLPKWTGFYKDLDDFCTKMLSFWSWDKKRKGKEKLKEAKRFIRESKTAQSGNAETQNFLPIAATVTTLIFGCSTKNQVLRLALDFLFFSEISSRNPFTTTWYQWRLVCT